VTVTRVLLLPVVLLATAAAAPVPPDLASEWPMFGGTPSRNMVNPRDRIGVPRADPGQAPKALWTVDVAGYRWNYLIQPVVAGDRVYLGVNNSIPRNMRDTTVRFGEIEPLDKGILLCLDAATGRLHWQAVHDKLPERAGDWPHAGVNSVPAIDYDRVYYVSNQCKVVCLDARGLADGNQGFQGEKYTDPTDADVLWEYDLVKELGVVPHSMCSGCPLVVGDRLFVTTSNGVDGGHQNLPAPDAPSFVCLDKNTGRLLWKDASPGKTLMHMTWGSPAYAAGPVPQVIFPGGDGWLYGFTPDSGRLLWKFDCNPKDAVYDVGGHGTRNAFGPVAPVVANGRVYVGTGDDHEHSVGPAHFWCVDLRKAVENAAKSPGRDVSAELAGPTKKGPGGVEVQVGVPNPHSAAAWCLGGPNPDPLAVRDHKFSRTHSTACVVDGLVYVAELAGNVHCLNARTGEHYWQYDTKATIHGSPFYVDGKVFVGTDASELLVFRHDPSPERMNEADIKAADPKDHRAQRLALRKRIEARYLLARIELDGQINSTPVAAGGVLYVATDRTLYAIRP
jgi:outer membrane protein assembly factor BamB